MAPLIFQAASSGPAEDQGGLTAEVLSCYVRTTILRLCPALFPLECSQIGRQGPDYTFFEGDLDHRTLNIFFYLEVFKT